MKVVQGPLKPLEVGQYHHRQPRFVQIQRAKRSFSQREKINDIVQSPVLTGCINLNILFSKTSINRVNNVVKIMIINMDLEGFVRKNAKMLL